ncbi:MAG TPA: hypothetical protein VGC06_32840 [Actinomycetes bacterium]
MSTVTTATTVGAATTEPPVLAPTVPDQVERDAREETSRGRTLAWKLLEGLAYAAACVDPSGILAMQRIREDMARRRYHDHR